MEKNDVPKKQRLKGYVRMYLPDRNYGFVVVRGVIDERTGKQKEWHLHQNSMRRGHEKAISAGVMVEFTPKPCPKEGKCDKATDVEVVG